MKIAIVGSGFVKLVTRTCFAEMEKKVTCIYKDKAKVDKLKSYQTTIYEPGLEQLLYYYC